MTGLASDLTDALIPYVGSKDAARIAVPLGLLRACMIHVTRFDAGPLFDRGREVALRQAEAREMEIAA
jgi:hypothetical protein